MIMKLYLNGCCFLFAENEQPSIGMGRDKNDKITFVSDIPVIFSTQTHIYERGAVTTTDSFYDLLQAVN